MSTSRSIARSNRLDYTHRIFGLSDYNLAASSAIEGLPDEQRSSPVRRTYLLLLALELLLTFLLWMIYLKVQNDFTNVIHKEIARYRFNSSLFDIQVLGFGRFLLLEIFYGGFLRSCRWPCIVSTTVTSLYVIAKCISFNFGSNDPPAVGWAYALLIYSIIMVWACLVFFEYRVLPQERMAEQITKNFERCSLPPIEDDESIVYPSIRQWASQVAAASRYTASIYASPQGSVSNADIEPLLSHIKVTTYGTTDAVFDVAALLGQASKIRQDARKVFEIVSWKICKSSSHPSAPTVSSTNLPEYSQRVFKLEGFIQAPAGLLFNDLVHGVELYSSWNDTVASAKFIQTFPGESLDIVHTVAKDALGGLIKSRDFVILRSWGEESSMLQLASASVLHPKCPASSDHTRGEQLINAIMLLQLGKSTRLVWITSVDPKGWLPGNLVERGITGSLVDFFSALQSRAATLCMNNNQDRFATGFIGSPRLSEFF